jgi:hypothetical protein
MNEFLSTQWKRCLAWVCCIWFVLGVANVCAAETKYLSINASFTGTGENPNPGDSLEGAKQEWGLSHVYLGNVEVVIQEIEISPAPNRRTRWVITPVDSAGRTNRVMGSIRDTAMNGFKEFGEGGSFAEHDGQAVWSAVGPVEARDLGLSLTLEPEAGVWSAEFSPGVARAALFKRETYNATANRTPGPKGFGELWQYVTSELNDRGWIPPSENADQRLVFTGFHPRDSVPLAGRIIQKSLLSSGTNYTGSETIPLLVALPGKGSISLTLIWTLLDALPEVELVVRSPRYPKWLPKLQPDGSPGEKLRLMARVESPNFEDLSRIQCESIRWTLVDTSREPGICMNYPLNALFFDPKTPDLRITEIPTDTDGQVGDEPEPENNRSEIEIEPHDWGGWSVLRVEAKLKDGRLLKGRLENPPDPEGEYDIRLPLRKPQSKIAKVWLEQEGVSDQDDAVDKDPLPKGKPGIHGDGLTLYQEYRGFQVKGSHLRTNPKVKDLFIRNSAGPLAASAIQKFDNISGLEVHLPQLDEFDPEGQSFKINPNRKYGPTRGLQAGLLVKGEGFLRPNNDIPKGTQPRDHIPIAFPRDNHRVAHGGISSGEASVHFVLQALFQSVAVQRPGPTDDSKYFVLKTQPPGSATPPHFLLLDHPGATNGKPVIVWDLASADLAQKWNAAKHRALERELRKISPNLSEEDRAYLQRTAGWNITDYLWLVGAKGGAHSGPEECVMRDWFAQVHESEFTGPGGLKVYRYIDPEARQEKPGDVLGATQDGTGINHATSNRPESRYGPRTAPGPANQQLIVNDNP